MAVVTLKAASCGVAKDSTFRWSMAPLKRNGTDTFKILPPARSPSEMITRFRIAASSFGQTYSIMARIMSVDVISGALTGPYDSLARSGLLKWKWCRFCCFCCCSTWYKPVRVVGGDAKFFRKLKIWKLLNKIYKNYDSKETETRGGCKEQATAKRRM